MSWSLSATGTPAHLKEYVKRHLHHYNQSLSSDEKGVVRHVVSHGLDSLNPSDLYSLTAGGHSDDVHYSVDVRVDKIVMSALPPEVVEVVEVEETVIDSPAAE